MKHVARVLAAVRVQLAPERPVVQGLEPIGAGAGAGQHVPGPLSVVDVDLDEPPRGQRRVVQTSCRSKEGYQSVCSLTDVATNGISKLCSLSNIIW